MLALKREKLEGFWQIICAFGCTNYMEVVEGIEDVSLGTISLDIHYKSKSGFETYFLSREITSNFGKRYLFVVLTKKWMVNVTKCVVVPDNPHK